MNPAPTIHRFGPVELHNHSNELSGLATIRLCDPDRRQALGSAMFDGLELAIEKCEALTGSSRFHPLSEPPPANAVRVVMMESNGTTFCSGFDLRALVDDPDPSQPLLASFLRRLAGCLRRLRALPAVSVSVVQGPALAGGCALATACDLTIASPDACFGYPTHLLGVSPAVSGPVFHARSNSARPAFLEGEKIDAATALQRGIVWALAPHTDQLASLARQTAMSLLAKGPRALAATKQWLLDHDDCVNHKSLQNALQASLSLVGGEESRRLVRHATSARPRA